MHKVHIAEIARYGEPALIITAAYKNHGGYPRAEAYVLLPTDEDEPFVAEKLTYEPRYPESNSVKDESLDTLLHHAFDVATLRLGEYLKEQNEFGAAASFGRPATIEKDAGVFAAWVLNGHLGSLAFVGAETEEPELKKSIEMAALLPAVVAKSKKRQ